jgi:hypothetical protein
VRCAFLGTHPVDSTQHQDRGAWLDDGRAYAGPEGAAAVRDRRCRHDVGGTAEPAAKKWFARVPILPHEFAADPDVGLVVVIVKTGPLQACASPATQASMCSANGRVAANMTEVRERAEIARQNMSNPEAILPADVKR